EPEEQEAEHAHQRQVGPQVRRGVGGGVEDRLPGGEVEPAAAQQQREREEADEALHGAALSPCSRRLARSAAASAPGASRVGSSSPVRASLDRNLPTPADMPPKSSAAAAARAAATRAGSSRQAATTSGRAANEPA